MAKATTQPLRGRTALGMLPENIWDNLFFRGQDGLPVSLRDFVANGGGGGGSNDGSNGLWFLSEDNDVVMDPTGTYAPNPAPTSDLYMTKTYYGDDAPGSGGNILRLGQSRIWVKQNQRTFLVTRTTMGYLLVEMGLYDSNTD